MESSGTIVHFMSSNAIGGRETNLIPWGHGKKGTGGRRLITKWKEGEERREKKKGKNRRKEIFIKERKKKGSRTQEKKRRKNLQRKRGFQSLSECCQTKKGEIRRTEKKKGDFLLSLRQRARPKKGTKSQFSAGKL